MFAGWRFNTLQQWFTWHLSVFSLTSAMYLSVAVMALFVLSTVQAAGKQSTISSFIQIVISTVNDNLFTVDVSMLKRGTQGQNLRECKEAVIKSLLVYSVVEFTEVNFLEINNLFLLSTLHEQFHKSIKIILIWGLLWIPKLLSELKTL